MIIGQKVYLRQSMFIGYYKLTGWEVNLGQEVCIRSNMVKGQEKLLGYLLKKEMVNDYWIV